MEVLSIFSGRVDLINLFRDFASNYPLIKLTYEDADTKYYSLVNAEKSEIYIYNNLSNPEDEFSYNYSETDQQTIRSHYNNSNFYLFDIQYRDELFLKKLLIDFKRYLSNKGVYDINEILLSHPFLGLITLQNFEPS